MPERARPLAVQISTRQLGEVLICAVRYALGRKTWIPEVVATVLCQHAPALPANDRQVIARDIREWMDRSPDYPLTVDGRAWQQALAAMEDPHA